MLIGRHVITAHAGVKPPPGRLRLCYRLVARNNGLHIVGHCTPAAARCGIADVKKKISRQTRQARRHASWYAIVLSRAEVLVMRDPIV